MKLIDKAAFLKYKKSDTIVIWGSGASIKEFTNDDFNYLSQFDSISTTAFCKTGIKTTFYIIGEILFNYYRAKNQKTIINGKKLSELYYNSGDGPNEYLNFFKNYEDTCFIIWNDNYTLNSEHMEQFNNLPNDYILVKQYGHDPNIYASKLNIDISTGPRNHFVDKKLYTPELLLDNKILLHPWKGINTPIYIAKCLGYKKIILAGIDLTAGPNSYCFDRSKFVNTIASQIHPGHKNNTIHPCKEMLFKFINYLKPDTYFTTYNENSLLTKIVDVDINRHKIIVSLATTPTRIKFIENTIKSILNQTIKPDIIYINIPYLCKKENKEYIIPDFLYKYKNIKINRFSIDLGASNKLIPILDIYKNTNNKYIITIDDDIIVGNNVIELIVNKLETYKIVSNHVWTIKEYINKITYTDIEKYNYLKNIINNMDYDILIPQTKICGFHNNIFDNITLNKLINNEYPFEYYQGNDMFYGLLLNKIFKLKINLNKTELEYGNKDDALCKGTSLHNYIKLLYDFFNNNLNL